MIRLAEQTYLIQFNSFFSLISQTTVLLLTASMEQDDRNACVSVCSRLSIEFRMYSSDAKVASVRLKQA